MGGLCEAGLVVAVSGKPGSGKTTLARSLARDLGLRYVSMGEIFRSLARSRAMSLEELSRAAEEDPSIDHLIDGRALEEARSGCVVIDGHISAWILRDVAHVKILTYAPLSVRAERLARRDGKTVEEALREIRVREESEASRYRRYYSIDVNDIDVFDIIINTSSLGVEEMCALASEAVRTLAPMKLKFKRGGRRQQFSDKV